MTATKETDPQNEPEGDEPPAYGLDTYPLDSVLIRTEQRAIVDVLRRIDDKDPTILLNPDFQRDFVWDRARQSRLIESVLLRIPLPVFYVAEDAQGRLVVVDGLQRLTTFQRFANKKLELELSNPELSGKDIDGIDKKLKRRFEDGQLTFYSIDFKAPDRVRFDIFDRVNSGVPLTRQQMRNALYSGPATALLRELAATTEFDEATGGSFGNQERYRLEQFDRQAINRFLAFQVLGWQAYQPDRPDMDEFLGRGLTVVNRMSAAERAALRDGFLRAMRTNTGVLDRYAFRKVFSDGRRGPFSAVLFEVFATVLAPYPEARVGEKSKALRDAYLALMNDAKFLRAISADTTARESVAARFSIAETAVREVLGDP